MEILPVGVLDAAGRHFADRDSYRYGSVGSRIPIDSNVLEVVVGESRFQFPICGEQCPAGPNRKSRKLTPDFRPIYDLSGLETERSALYLFETKTKPCVIDVVLDEGLLTIQLTRNDWIIAG